MIDGEAVLLGVDGRSDFDGLHSRKHDHEVQFYAFDMLVRPKSHSFSAPPPDSKAPGTLTMSSAGKPVASTGLWPGWTGTFPVVLKPAEPLRHGRNISATSGPSTVIRNAEYPENRRRRNTGLNFAVALIWINNTTEDLGRCRNAERVGSVLTSKEATQ